MLATSLKLDVKESMIEIIDLLNRIDLDDYIKPILYLSNGTIGQHTRHIIELFSQLFIGYSSGIVNYDFRKRDLIIETKIDFAIESIAQIISNIDKEDKPILIESLHSYNNHKIVSSYYRELLYNLEHCTHHKALIKVAILELDLVMVSNEFGVSKSTILNKK